MITPSPDLAARLTLARAITSDFTRQTSDDAWPRIDWLEWAHRLNAALSGLITALDSASGPALTGGAFISGPDLLTVLAALDHASAIGTNSLTLARYRALARALGDDR